MDRDNNTDNYNNSITLPLELLNKNACPAEYIIIYAWVKLAIIHGDNQINYKSLGILTGLGRTKISIGLNFLEKIGMIELKRKSGKLYAYINEIPDSLKNILVQNQENVILNEKIKDINKTIRTKSIPTI